MQFSVFLKVLEYPEDSQVGLSFFESEVVKMGIRIEPAQMKELFHSKTWKFFQTSGLGFCGDNKCHTFGKGTVKFAICAPYYGSGNNGKEPHFTPC
jgi:hypothetical protein